MSLLLDHNLSPRLVVRLQDLFPHSVHVVDAGLATALDSTVWQYAVAQQLTLVTKDADFADLSVLLGNCTTGQIEATMRRHAITIVEFLNDPTAAMLAIR